MTTTPTPTYYVEYNLVKSGETVKSERKTFSQRQPAKGFLMLLTMNPYAQIVDYNFDL
jgi:hypothetical protein